MNGMGNEGKGQAMRRLHATLLAMALAPALLPGVSSAAQAEPKGAAKAEPAKAEPAEGEVKPWPALALSEEAAGQTLGVVAGRRIEIRLPGNITTGYSWVVGELTPGPVVEIGKARYVQEKRPEGIVGAGGTFIFAFVGTAPGKANLRLEYKRPWEKEKPARSFRVGFDVKADPTPERAKALKADLDTFWLELRYWGNQDKPFYNVILQTAELLNEYPPYVEASRFTKEDAAKVVDWLGEDGFLALSSHAPTAGLPAPPGPCYTLTVREKAAGEFYENLGWDLAMLGRLDGLRKVLSGDAAKALDTLVGRMSGYRKEWSGAAAPREPKAP
jgi:inhibitor of cysteine peptidase